jgi:uncharacterized protein YbjQ (UPF0145 family)
MAKKKKDEQAAPPAEAPYEVAPVEPVRAQMVTTANSLDGHRVKQSLGVVRGIVVRSRSLIGNIGAAFQSLKGGNISIFTKLCEQTRQEAFTIMLQHAAQIGANAVVAMRYDATELSDGITEVLAYGTAVVVEPDGGAYR